MSSKQGHGEPNPTWIPVGNESDPTDGREGRRYRRRHLGRAVQHPADGPLPLGGAAIGDSAQTGVIDPYHRVYNYPTLFVTDGAAISANLGVNPSLSIAAQAERARHCGRTRDRTTRGRPRVSPTAGSNRSHRTVPSSRPRLPARCAGCRSPGLVGICARFSAVSAENRAPSLGSGRVEPPVCGRAARWLRRRGQYRLPWLDVDDGRLAGTQREGSSPACRITRWSRVRRAGCTSPRCASHRR